MAFVLLTIRIGRRGRGVSRFMLSRRRRVAAHGVCNAEGREAWRSDFNTKHVTSSTNKNRNSSSDCTTNFPNSPPPKLTVNVNVQNTCTNSHMQGHLVRSRRKKEIKKNQTNVKVKKERYCCSNTLRGNTKENSFTVSVSPLCRSVTSCLHKLVKSKKP